jgi:hypothetical protein
MKVPLAVLLVVASAPFRYLSNDIIQIEAIAQIKKAANSSSTLKKSALAIRG